MNSEEAAHVKHLAAVFEDAIAQNQILSARVEKVIDTNRMTRRLTLSLAAVAMTLGLLSLPVLYTVAQIYSCTAPNGSCTKRSAKNLQTTIVAVSVRSELERNKTELDRATEQGNQADIVFRTKAVEAKQVELDQLGSSAK